MSDYSNPWSAVGSIIGGGMTRNASEAAKYARQGQQNALGWGRGPNDNMVYSSAPQLDRSASDNTTPAEVLGNIGDMFLPGSKAGAKAYPLIGSAVQAEKDLYAPTESAVSGVAVADNNSIDNAIQRFKRIYGNVYR